MPLIDIHHASPLTDDQAAALIADLTAAYTAVTGGDPNTVTVLIQPVEATRWGVGGQSLAARRAS